MFTSNELSSISKHASCQMLNNIDKMQTDCGSKLWVEICPHLRQNNFMSKSHSILMENNKEQYETTEHVRFQSQKLL